ncbi:MAG: hypothetical protein HYZ84_04530, partial [Candidatus Omnitrophica bacterium]|nr:hypothetical protein [Candidatus Omnitrophota bacterium]
MKKYFLFFVLAVFGAAAYSSSFSGPFLFDDHSIIITDNYFVQNPAAWWKFIGSKRALVNGTFALNYFLQGEKVEGFHLVNFIIHLVNAFLIFG